jgi:hypothetical protein
MEGGEKTLPEVASDNFLFIANGGEIDPGIPALKYIDIRRYTPKQALHLRSWAGRAKKRLQQFGDAGAVHNELKIVDGRRGSQAKKKIALRATAPSSREPGLAIFCGVCQVIAMKKQLADQSFHDRKYQDRKRAEAARKPSKKKVVEEKSKADQKSSA